MKIYLVLASLSAIVVADDANVLNEGLDCWDPCGSQQGACGWCGSDGICCTQKDGWTDVSNGCDGTFGGLTRHECVLNPNRTTCDASQWPDLDHGLVCGDCKALINKMSSEYITCHNYCTTIGLICTGAWEESGDTCTVKSTETCEHEFTDTSDAICECGSSTPGQCVDMKLQTYEYGREISWTFGTCSSNQLYDSHTEYMQQCCLATGEYKLTCYDSEDDGWHGAFIEIQGKKYCEDFLIGYEAIKQVTIGE